MDDGMSRIAQCHQPEGIGASGSKQVSMKLAVSSGKPCHVRSGERDPASAVADSGIGAPSVRTLDDLVDVHACSFLDVSIVTYSRAIGVRDADV
ncbi:Uncharacterised protein [Mycobacteroides abscessus subsp. abscessus]|nr:Uncharacterised protein [Mycobacteroides abscessus subsp. abscessus]